jgi:hypothetical protein
VLTAAAYAKQVAAGDTGRWRAATRRSAAWLSPHSQVVDLGRQIPLAQLALQSLALLIYALASGRGGDSDGVSAGDVLGWLADHRIPLPPEPGAAVSREEFGAALSGWRHEVEAAADRCCRDLSALLVAAGHDVPEPGFRRLDRYSPDPVINVWLGLVDTDAQAPQVDGLLDLFRPPLLVLGLTSLVDLVG